MLRVQVWPPSNVTPRNIPLAPSWMLVKTTMLLGLVGLTAMASSDSWPLRMLTSMFGGGSGLALATLTAEAASAPIRPNAASAASTRFLLIKLSSGDLHHYR